MRPLREIEAELRRVNRQLDLEHDPGYRPTIQGACPNPSRQTRTPRRIETSTPVGGRCGRTALLRKGRRLRLGWLPCNCLHCDQCRPRLIHQRIDHYLELIGDQKLYEHRIARSVWAAWRRKLGRQDGRYLRFDAPGGMYLVLSTVDPDGQCAPIVGDLAELLASAFAQLPKGGRVTSSRAWALARVEQTPSGWTLEGISDLPVEDVAQVADELGLYAGGGFLQHTDDPARWGAFILRIGLHLPDHHRWWTGAAA